jgi:alginate O-acetyltransferase complex protein AlgI
MIGLIGVTPLPKRLAERINARFSVFLEPVAVLALLLLSTASVVDGSFNPFIYFRF